LTELARARNPLAAAAEAQALITTLTTEDFRELAAQLKDFPFPSSSPGGGAIYGRAYMDALVRRWLEVDPEGGAAAMRALEGALTYKREHGLVVNCDAKSPRRGLATTELSRLGSATDGKANIAALAALAGEAERADEEKFFGPLQRITNGVPTQANLMIRPRVAGIITLSGVDRRLGQGVHVLAVIDPANGACSAAFHLGSSQAVTRLQGTPRATPTPQEVAAQIAEKYRPR
jgi:hypothetical protein